MIKVRWKLDCGRVYLELKVLGNYVYYWFPKRGCNKRFHPRSIFTRQINNYSSYEDPFIPKYVSAKGWIEGEIGNKVVIEKLGIHILTWEELYDKFGKVR